jgi:copper chaperone CopZ
MKSVVSIEGMSCGHCVMRVKSALEAVPGVSSVSVDLTSGKASVEGTSLDANMLRGAVEKAGYQAVSILP